MGKGEGEGEGVGINCLGCRSKNLFFYETKWREYTSLFFHCLRMKTATAISCLTALASVSPVTLVGSQSSYGY